MSRYHREHGGDLMRSAQAISAAATLGADWCNAARGFMFAVGCLQSQQCHTDRCPTGVATQDRLRQRAIVISDKSLRVAHFHRETVIALAELIAAAGLNHPRELRPYHFMRRTGPDRIVSFTELYRFMEPGELLSGTTHPSLKEAWEVASPESFAPQGASGPGNIMLAAE